MQFGWERSRFSRIHRICASTIYQRWKHLLRFDPHRLTPQKLEQYAQAIHAKGCPLKNISSFIDGTLDPNSRPVRNQRMVYNGWKRVHCLKFHSVVTPDGLHSHVYGPVEGRRHDETLYKQSGLAELLAKHFWTPAGEPLYVYGDPAYGIGAHLLSPYKGPAVTEDQRRWNSKMSKVREAVEWGFREVYANFAFMNFTKNKKILLQPCGLYYMVAILMCNAHTILHNPEIPQYFDCAPPTLDEYFRGGPIDDDELERWAMEPAWEEREVPEGELDGSAEMGFEASHVQ